MAKKILVVNMNYMGDALLTTPALAALRHAHPDAQIDTVVGKGAAAEVLQDNPDLDAVIARTAQDSWSRCTQIYSLLREGRYTDTIILPPLAAYAAAAWMARTPVRIGQANRDMDRFLTHPQRIQSAHMADIMLETLPISSEERSLRRRLNVTISRAHMEKASQLLAVAGIDPKRPLIGVNLGATRPQKRWFVESFAAVLDALPDIQAVLVGAGAEDMERAVQVQQFSHKTAPANLVGRTSVKELAAVLAQCDLVISADSGPMHLATAVGVPTIALFGSTDPMATGPYDTVSRVLYKDLSCAPCGNHPTCQGRYDCLRAITPEEVALNVRSLLRERRGAGAVPLTMVAEPSLTKSLASECLAGERELPASLKSLHLPLGKQGPGYKRHLDQANADKIRSILIVTKFRFIGDTLLAIPIFRAARAQWPEARIVLLTGKNASALLQHNPYLDEIIEFDPYKANYGMRPYVSLIKRLGQGRFDLCLALNRSFHSALTPWLSRVKIRAGFRSEGRGPLLNRRVEYDREKSEIACYFDVLHAAAPDAFVNPTLELWVSNDERCQGQTSLIEAFGRLPSCLVGIQPGASLVGKQWGAARFAAVADALAADPEVRIALIGGADETEVAEEMLAACAPETRSRIASFVGRCSLRESLALVSHLNLFIGNDTAVMHSAVALRVPTVALFGPTNPRKWGNYGSEHRVIESSDGTMANVSVGTVTEAARSLLATL